MHRRSMEISNVNLKKTVHVWSGRVKELGNVHTSD